MIHGLRTHHRNRLRNALSVPTACASRSHHDLIEPLGRWRGRGLFLSRRGWLSRRRAAAIGRSADGPNGQRTLAHFLKGESAALEQHLQGPIRRKCTLDRRASDVLNDPLIDGDGYFGLLRIRDQRRCHRLRRYVEGDGLREIPRDSVARPEVQHSDKYHEYWANGDATTHWNTLFAHSDPAGRGRLYVVCGY